jgi:inhibitor of KinA
MEPRIVRLSETSLIIYLGEEIDTDLIQTLTSLSQAISSKFRHGIVDVIPSYTSVFVEFHPLRVTYQQINHWLNETLSRLDSLEHMIKPQQISLPVYYHPDVAPDLESLAKERGLTVEEVIQIHSQIEYTVCAIGFAPGFAFLASVDERIAMPRHAEPKSKVAKGSVGIAGRQTAVYPLETPGGWQVIGNCPMSLFTPEQSPMMPFNVGDLVRFGPISRDEFIALGGQL